MVLITSELRYKVTTAYLIGISFHAYDKHKHSTSTRKPKLFVHHAKAAADAMEDTAKDAQSLNGLPIVFE
jgi:hypothetical protein